MVFSSPYPAAPPARTSAFQEGLSLAARVLGAENLSFEDVRYIQGAEVPIVANLNFALQRDGDDSVGEVGLIFARAGLAGVVEMEHVFSRRKEVADNAEKRGQSIHCALYHRIAQMHFLSSRSGYVGKVLREQAPSRMASRFSTLSPVGWCACRLCLMTRNIYALEFLVVGTGADHGRGEAVLAALVIGLLVLLAGCLMILFSTCRRRRASNNQKRLNVKVGTVGFRVSYGYIHADPST